MKTYTYNSVYWKIPIDGWRFLLNSTERLNFILLIFILILILVTFPCLITHTVCRSILSKNVNLSLNSKIIEPTIPFIYFVSREQ